jgi:RNA-binding protein YlmH
MEQSEEQLKKRFVELAEKSERNSQYLFTDFLSLAEQDLFYQAMRGFTQESYSVSGGVEGAERVMVRFGSVQQFGYEIDFPIVCIMIRPLLEKFAENLSHRDYLGALMNLGIERARLGDIIIRGKTAYLFCEEHMADYIIEKLDKVRHTNVKCERSEQAPQEAAPTLSKMELIVSAERADSIVAKVFQLSRSASLELFRGKKIFVNGRICENNSTPLKSENVVSVRGYGKFCYSGVVQETKKGKIRVSVEKYL